MLFDPNGRRRAYIMTWTAGSRQPSPASVPPNHGAHLFPSSRL